MAAKWIDVVLQVWDPGCNEATARSREAIAKTLGAQVGGAVVAIRERHGVKCSTLVAFARVQLAEFGRDAEAYERFADALEQRLLAAAEWLDQRPVELFAALRREHANTRILVTSFITQDQLDLDFPAQFLASCGRAGLGISILTNE